MCTSKTKTYTGRWWPIDGDDEQEEYTGTLTFDPNDGTRLEFSFIDTHHKRHHLIDENKPVWHGITESREKITLAHAFFTEVNPSPQGLTTGKLFSNYLIVGDHVPGTDSQHYSVRIRINSFDNWLNIEALSDVKRSGNTYTISAESKSISMHIEAINACITITKGISTKETIGTKFEVNTDAYIDVSTYTPKSISWFEKMSFSIKELLSLIYGEKAIVKKLEILNNHVKHYEGVPNYTYLDIKRPIETSDYSDNISLPRFLLYYSIISKYIDNIFSTWFSFSEEKHKMIDLFINVANRKGLYPHVTLISLMQAFEAHHRLESKGEYLSPKEYEPIRTQLSKAIPNDISSDLKSRIKSAITYCYQYSLRKRLDLSIKALPDTLSSLVTTNKRLFINTTCDTRNYYTHRDEDMEGKVISDFKLINLNIKITKLLTIILLRDIGISDNLILNRFNMSQKFREIDTFPLDF